MGTTTGFGLVLGLRLGLGLAPSRPCCARCALLPSSSPHATQLWPDATQLFTPCCPAIAPCYLALAPCFLVSAMLHGPCVQYAHSTGVQYGPCAPGLACGALLATTQ